MQNQTSSVSQDIRSKLDHPIIDSDGHNLELTPVFLEFVKAHGGEKLRNEFEQRLKESERTVWMDMSDEQRRYAWLSAPAWWGFPARNTLDRATASLPRLQHRRMDELGIDYAVIYPTWRPGLMRFADEQDEEIRRLACRALNAYHADIYGECSDRMTPAAMIPMHTPKEAIEELSYAVETLGLKVAAIASVIRRPIAQLEKECPSASTLVHRLDTLGLDSDHDYDSFWSKCMELKIVPACHASAFEWEGQGSISNYMYNHIGAFARANDAFCKSLFMGGVTRRFPELKFAFLEGGVGWACALYSDLISHWEKRNRKSITHLDPKRIDYDLFLEMVDEYGNDAIKSERGRIEASIRAGAPTPANVDDWHHVAMERVEDMKALFVESFYFGCEADDPMNVWAFDKKVNPLGAELKAIFSSDIGHWDVPDIRGVQAEAYELVTDEIMTPENFKAFTFGNSVELYTSMNLDFFVDTAVEQSVAPLRAL